MAGRRRFPEPWSLRASRKYAADRMATVKDIAAAVGVSVATVSNVLNGKPNVGSVIRKKVLHAAKQLGYRPNRAAQAMRTGRTRAIGLVLPDLTNPFFPELAQAVENKARSLGLLVCLIDSQGSADGESDGFALLMQHAVDGVIWCPVGARPPAALRKLDRPVILVDRPGLRYPVVHSNYLAGGELLAQYVLRMGHERVGLLSGPTDLQSARLRRDGFVNACRGELQIVWEVNVGFDGLLTAAAIDALLEHRNNVSLIVAGNDLIAISAIRCLTEHGVKVPQDMSITGFDNIRWADLVTPRLTTVAQPMGAIAAKAVELMHKSLSGQIIPARHTLFEVTLIERDSVKRL
jgi:LacI family transcriptional regulator